MRFDEASTQYGEFGDFYVGYLVEPEQLGGAN
jgi:chlorite dismutase